LLLSTVRGGVAWCSLGIVLASHLCRSEPVMSSVC
jgi:hypothetical protein